MYKNVWDHYHQKKVFFKKYKKILQLTWTLGVGGSPLLIGFWNISELKCTMTPHLIMLCYVPKLLSKTVFTVHYRLCCWHAVLTGMSFLSFRIGTLGGIVDCLSAGLSLSPLWGEFSPLPTMTETWLNVWRRKEDGVCKRHRQVHRLSCRSQYSHTDTFSYIYIWFWWVQFILGKLKTRS